MKNKKFDIDKLVKKVIEESLQEKADELTSKVKSKMDEWNPNGPVTISGVDVSEADDVEERLCDEDSPEYDSERCEYNRKAKTMGNSDELGEIETKNLEKGKKYKFKSPSFQDELEFEKEDEFLGGKPMYSFKGKEMKHSMGDKSVEDFISDIDEELIGGQKKLDKNKNGKLDAEDFRILRKGKKTEESESWFSGDDEISFDDEEEFIPKRKKRSDDDRYSAFDKVRMGQEPEDIDWEEIDSEDIEEEVEEGNEFTGALAKAKEDGKKEFEVGGKKYPVKESLQLSEEELITLIEQIVEQEKKNVGVKPKGLTQTEKVLSADKKQNDEYIKSVTKKLTDYLKGGSKGKYEMSPKHFPKGNGELAKMDKKTYSADKSVDEYIENFTAAGLENLVYDEIHPNEEWIDKNIEGSSVTGNNPEWANAVDTGLNKKRNKIRKDNLLGAVKALAYNKAPQPAYDSKKAGPSGKFEKNFGKGSAIKASKILNQLESKEDKKDKLLGEEFDRINQLIDYTKRTQ